MKYHSIPSGTEEILRLIARVPSGRAVLEGFLPLYRAQKIRFEPYPEALLAQLRAALGEGQPVGACFVNDGAQGQIHFDPAAPIGVLAPFLVHEMVHAQDTSLWIAGSKRLKRAERDRLMLEAETRAFELQHKFVEELRQADPEYSDYLKSQQARVRVLHEKLLESDIAALYGLEVARGGKKNAS